MQTKIETLFWVVGKPMNLSPLIKEAKLSGRKGYKIVMRLIDAGEDLSDDDYDKLFNVLKNSTEPEIEEIRQKFYDIHQNIREVAAMLPAPDDVGDDVDMLDDYDDDSVPPSVRDLGYKLSGTVRKDDPEEPYKDMSGVINTDIDEDELFELSKQHDSIENKPVVNLDDMLDADEPKLSSEDDDFDDMLDDEDFDLFDLDDDDDSDDDNIGESSLDDMFGDLPSEPTPQEPVRHQSKGNSLFDDILGAPPKNSNGVLTDDFDKIHPEVQDKFDSENAEI